MEKPYLSIIIPAYNEAKRLPETLADINKKIKELKFPSGKQDDYEIIVVNDGSKDATVDAAERFKSLIDNFKLIDNKKNHGKGWVVRQGMLEAKGKIRLFTDADNSTSLEQFNNMIPYFEEGYDVVIGSRDIKGAKLVPPQPWYKRLAGNIGNLIIQILLLPGIWDTQCGFKAFTKESAENIFSLIKSERWAFDVEALALAKKCNYKIKEIPITWVNSVFSHVKMSAYLKSLLEVFKIKWWLINFDKNYKSLKLKK
ncbi:glycosyltransferase family 2 protein [Candidatus Wolfebacteria bacterium]|nr:glycosyltransferase family 2 protein [Candidatus Wolfebacteria bacterium]